ncbi:mitochondrial ornithine transporter 1 [Drosophila nasuta]|uniref:Mitochondrial ornithine transporter 1 n=1 Tax=Drosophila albomicans TaxID=7291 RepID=A0A6P8Z362_DROAB|nr:mitochondrial ornithine transporter 1 [Drosophila albomicans]XP_060661410.1 mitochondrial ornithine transporter 1 [Drosophila nasuta]
MSPTAAEITAATLTPPREAKNNNSKNDAYQQQKTESAASTLAATTMPTASKKSKASKPMPPLPPDISTSTVGSGILLMTPEQIAEAYEKAVRDEKSDDGRDGKSDGKGGESSKFSLLGVLKSCADIRLRLLRLVGRFLSFILHLDMHGGSTGNNINFVSGLIDFFAGSLGGAAQVYVSQPLDTVKVKMQTFPEKYKGMLDCFVTTYQRDGVMRGLYAGSVPAVFANVAENSVLFAAYGGCQKFVTYVVGKELASELTTTENACAGSLAACFSTLTLCPTELIKCKLQALRDMKQFVEPTQTADIRTPWTLTRYIWRTEGIRGFYRGLGSTFIREMPGYFFFFGSYEGTRELLRKEGQTKDEIGPFRTMVAGAIGGVCLWTSTFPADVIKSRIQVKNLNEGMFTVGADIVRREGVLALYRGLLPSVLRTIPATATLFVVYEYTKKALHGATL